MGIERTLRVGKTNIEVFLDRNLHLFDMDLPGTMTLTNAIDEHYLGEVMGWLGNYRYDRVYLYHTDGFVSEWSRNGFKFVDYENEDLYFWFVEKIKLKKQEQYFVH